MGKRSGGLGRTWRCAPLQSPRLEGIDSGPGTHSTWFWCPESPVSPLCHCSSLSRLKPQPQVPPFRAKECGWEGAGDWVPSLPLKGQEPEQRPQVPTSLPSARGEGWGPCCLFPGQSVQGELADPQDKAASVSLWGSSHTQALSARIWGTLGKTQSYPPGPHSQLGRQTLVRNPDTQVGS